MYQLDPTPIIRTHNPVYRAHPIVMLNQYIHIQIQIYIYIYIHTYIHTCIHTYIHTHTDIHTYRHTYIHTHTDIHTYIQTYIQTYIHTHTQTYIHTYMHACKTYNEPTVPPNNQPRSVLGVRWRYAWVVHRPGHAPSDRTPGSLRCGRV